jgi:VanZ family protein
MSASAPTPRPALRAGPPTAGIVLRALSAVAVLVQCYGLYRPGDPLAPRWLPYADKWAHLLGFALPVALILITIHWWTGVVTRRSRMLVVIAFGAQAVLSELVQGHGALVGRSGDVVDLAADALGIAFGLALGTFLAPGISRAWPRRDRAGKRHP